jgi:hypothetical protein
MGFMAGDAGWYAALGAIGVAALWNAKRPGFMDEERDRIYRECLTGRVPVDRMRDIARALEKARCFPQAKMLRLRIGLKELPPEEQEQRRAFFEKGMVSKNKDAILRLAEAFENEGATTSAAKLRRHAEQLPRPDEVQPIVTPPPTPETPEEVSSSLLNGISHVAVSETPAITN